MAGEYLPPVVARITGDVDGLVAAVAKAKGALDALKASGGDVKVRLDASAASIAKTALAADALTAATNRNVRAGRTWAGWWSAAHMIMTTFGANIVADTIGIIAFGIGATSAISPVIAAIKNLGATYGYLTPVQQAATVRLTDFINQFRNANQTGIFAVFNGFMDLIGNHIGKTGGVMDQATQAFENFVAMLRQSFASGPWQQLFTRSTGIIQQDLTTLFRLIDAIINVIPVLVHDFNGWGLAVLNTASFLLHLVSILGNASPALARFAFGAFAVYRILRMIGAFNAGSGLRTFLAGIPGAFLAIGKAVQSVRQYGLGTTAFLLTGLTPALLTTAGAAAVVAAGVVALIYATRNVQSAGQALVGTLTAQDQATGNNIAGYEKLSNQLAGYVTRAHEVQAATYAIASRNAPAITTTNQLAQAQQRAAQQAQTLRGNLSYLEQTYHLTQGQAIQLAQKTGVNLAQAFAKGGGAAQQSRLKIQAYEQTVKAAQNPTSVLGYDLGLAANQALQLDDRVTALTNAFNALLTPFANVIQDTVTWKQGNQQLEKAVDQSNGKVGYANKLQQNSAAALATSITNTTNLSTAILNQTGSMQKAVRPVQNEINVLEGLHSKSSIVAQAIRILQQYIDQLHSKTITLTTNMVTTQTTVNYGTTYAHRSAQGGYASGTNSASPGWHWVGERGPELQYFRGGEKVVPHQASVAMAAAAGDSRVVEKQPIVVQIDGRTIYEVVKENVYYKNTQNGMRNKNGSVQGRFGIR